MFGFYDPASLSIGEKSAVINFINAGDASDVTTVMIDTPEAARDIRAALETQKVNGITLKTGQIVDFRGSISFNPKAPDEALLTLDDEEDFGRTIPMKMGFHVEAGELPRLGYAIGQAAEVDGALVVYRLAMRPFSIGFERDIAMPQTSHLN